MSPRWAPLHTRTRPASLYLNIQCARSSLTLITSPPASQPLSPPTRFFRFLSSVPLHLPPDFCLSPLAFLSLVMSFIIINISLSSTVSHPHGNTCTVLFSGIKHTQPLFFCHNTSDLLLPPLCSSSVIKLSSKGFLHVFTPVNWALWWTVNKPVNHSDTRYISDNTTNTFSGLPGRLNKYHCF